MMLYLIFVEITYSACLSRGSTLLLTQRLNEHMSRANSSQTFINPLAAIFYLLAVTLRKQFRPRPDPIWVLTLNLTHDVHPF